MKIPSVVRSAISASDHNKKISRLATQFQIASRNNPYPRKKDLLAWMYKQYHHLVDQVWEHVMKTCDYA